MVCTLKYLTDAVVIYGAGKPPLSPERWGLCRTHSRLRDRNLIALVEIDPAKSKEDPGALTMTPDRAHRTGTVVYLSRDMYAEFFNGAVPDNGVAFVDPDVVAYLQMMKNKMDGIRPN